MAFPTFRIVSAGYSPIFWSLCTLENFRYVSTRLSNRFSLLQVSVLGFPNADTTSGMIEAAFWSRGSFKQARSSFAAKSRSMLGLQITTPGFARENPGVGSVFPPLKMFDRKAIVYKVRSFPDSHLTRLAAMSTLRSHLAEFKAAQLSGLITDQQYYGVCRNMARVVDALWVRVSGWSIWAWERARGVHLKQSRCV